MTKAEAVEKMVVKVCACGCGRTFKALPWAKSRYFSIACLEFDMERKGMPSGRKERWKEGGFE